MKRIIALFYNTEQNNEYDIIVFGRIENNKILFNKQSYDVNINKEDVRDVMNNYNFRLDTHCDEFFDFYINDEWQTNDDRALKKSLCMS